MIITRGKRTEKRCEYCNKKFYPRVADVNRGWGRFCSKSCKANNQWDEMEEEEALDNILIDDFNGML